ncbi:DNA-directed RNA polymerase I subunit RPA1 [Trachymyrmex septentrionalis]|uniref:DNA-directed RNA polymerase subunit n=1 Tax=Trachymyrmex septentrionalis TaxID=34720 RepID=A0A195FVZ8_9HYME|nr:PREDICTED: DNA-directed RNA polymerase I subunit RPA1 [Trachymyrmex septentrionalis]XP_018347206.1 PREDICTED: DNA-directed RNA polymerase I subunit RPA1 [Trachymyrmex septentrionalis]XP_018347215.1 PREDICTED: DNA-directed RNA polymerase I subunit RPA1 [Trachymyrmex septentrionalis]KYN44618.1 DNA-directed RNA polymerase I subunit RPA1 [Trachymyrmex septentrionalis]
MTSKYHHKQRLTPKHRDSLRLIFSVFTANDIRNLSVTKIITSLTFNILGHPLKGGLYDPSLGITKNSSELCSTCGYNSSKCPGHFGHIELPVPVVNPLFHKALSMLLKLSCLSCFTLQVPSYIKLWLSAKLKLLYQGQLSDLDGLDHEVTSILSNIEKEEERTEYIRNVIDIYMQNFLNRNRYSQIMPQNPENQANIKSVIMQWHAYIENILKRYVRTNKAGICMNCHNGLPKMSTLQNKIMISNKEIVKNSKEMLSREVAHKFEMIMIMPDQSKEYLRQLWHNERDFLKIILPCLELVDIEYPTDIFFFEVIPVLPPIVRPVNFLNGQMVEHPQTHIYKSIIQDCLVLRNVIQTIQDGGIDHLPQEGRLVFEQIKGTTAVEKLHNAWQALQSNVNHLMDRDMNKSEVINSQGLKQILEKKEGIIRMHMMGKRVNFAARTVITPDPNLNIDEIGIAEAFARKLTYPTSVTPWNVIELRRLVLNGPNVHPGAVMVENEDGSIQAISSNDCTQREAIAKRLLTTSDRTNEFIGVKIVHRHLQNGDVLLINRQPTLHKPSIMAHKARVLKGEKTLHLHYANCKAYNADFDGDELNAHFPQNELARSESYNIANVSNQYLVPKDGTPLSGLIQDYMVSGVRLTTRGRFFSKAHYTQLVYTALPIMQKDIILLPPTIIKPKMLWSGKQILSTVIINIIPSHKTRINLISSTKIRAKEWQTEIPRRWKCGTEFKNSMTMSEAQVIIRHGELLCGVLDKMHYGATPYGLIHCIYELYGAICANEMLSAFGRLFQMFLQCDGFTLGVEDILITPEINEKRKEIISNCRKIGETVQKSVIKAPNDTPMNEIQSKMEESYWNNSKFRAQVDHKYKSTLDVYTNDINNVCLQMGLFKKFPNNNLQLMVQSGAKGSTVNTMQISCLLGQSELEGKRPPLMISGKSLSSFPAYDPTPRAGGFIDGRFMTGIKPQECFFHCMAGREGLIDTAVKTSRSGYLQRCLVKHLEGLIVSYDATVRDYDGSLIQFYYGEDGLDVPGSRFLTKNQIAFLVDNKESIMDAKLLECLKRNDKEIAKTIKKIKRWEIKNGSSLQKRRINEFSKFSMENSNQNNVKQKIIDSHSGRSKAALSLIRKWMRTEKELKESYHAQCTRCPDPIMSKYRQDVEFGVLSERIESLMDEYLSRPTKIKKSVLRDLLSIKVMKTICPPGEPVGLLAAQSIGEPSTQMTLNTFHFAGRGEMNVTLGIPRLREILMIASKNIKTPSMEIPFQNNLENLEKQAKKLRSRLTKCVLRDVLKDITISRRMEGSPHRRLVHTLKIKYLPHKYYKEEFSVHPRDVIKCTEEQFFKNIFKEIKKFAAISKVLIKLHFEGEKRRINDEDAAIDEIDPDEVVPENPESRTRMDLGEMHESSDEEEAAEDADATMTKSLLRHRENQEYEDPEEEEENEDIVLNDKEEAVDNNNANTILEDKEDDDDDTNKKLNRRKNNNNKSTSGKDRVLDMYKNAMDYDYDENKLSWCKFTFWLPLKTIKLDLPTIIKNAANKTVLWETKCIKKAFTFQNNKGETILKTDGLNIVEMFKYDNILDLNRLYSNDIYNISQTYGIEAANRVIVREIKDVFKMYGITVDVRHLSLIADYMTFDGTFKPLSRKGMENSASPLQQISFESSLGFLKTATLQGKKDDILSPSSRLMLGQPCKSGTGAFSILPSLYNM